MHQASLRLFNAIQVNTRGPSTHSQSVLERSLKHGYLLAPGIEPTEEVLADIERVVGISGEKANAAFHKSWKVVQDSSIESLVVQQLVHYFTTYGFEALGIYTEDAVYVPAEKLELPAIKEDIPLTVIRAFDTPTLLKHIEALGSGIALAQETLNDIMTLVKGNKFDGEFARQINNRELKAMLFDHFGLVPRDPTEYLRHLVSKLTDESLLIKNDALIEKLKKANGKFLDTLLIEAPDDLASIFFRFKPLILAMKTISNNKHFFNVLRKKANQLHKPVPTDYMNSITEQLKHATLDLDILKNRLAKASIFRKIRLAYALQHRLHAGNATVYRVRSGKGWATSFDWPKHLRPSVEQTMDVVVSSITDDIRPNVEGKTLYIPSDVHYALPATEKQFTGNLPSGTYVSVPKDMIVGIHWTNTKSRVDLDLSVVGESGKFGWDGLYRSGDKRVLFSGDMTDAPKPKGASELFYLKKAQGETTILMVNYYNFEKGNEVPAKIILAQESPKKFGENYMIDVNNLVATANLNIKKKQNILGLIVNLQDEMRFYFANVSIGNSISSSSNTQSTQTRNYLVNSMTHTLDFNNLLSNAGATVVDEMPEGECIDLSPQSLTKSTIIDLIKPATAIGAITSIGTT